MTEASSSDRTLSPAHIPALDGLRGCAILLVLLLHITLREPVVETAGVLAVRNTFALGWSGVDLFFVLSGFLITGILFDAKGSGGYFKVFYARRALRILPLYYAALLGVFVMPHFLGPRIAHLDLTPVREQFWYWAYLQNYHELKGVPREFLDGFWTLAIEEQFYLVWPLVIFFCSRRRALWVCLACVLGAIGYRSTMTFLGYSVDAIGQLTPARVDSLAIGSAIALLARGSGGLDLMKKLSPYAIATGTIVLLMTLVRAGPAYHRDALMVTVGFSAIPLAYGGVLVLIVASSGLFNRALRSSVLRFFGRYSYGLYVIHQPVLIVFAKLGVVPDRFLGIGSPGLALLAYTVFMLIVCVAVEWLVYQLYEKRFLLLKRHFVYGERARSASADAVAA